MYQVMLDLLALQTISLSKDDVHKRQQIRTSQRGTERTCASFVESRALHKRMTPGENGAVMRTLTCE
jgi:hypothetical protein